MTETALDGYTIAWSTRNRTLTYYRPCGHPINVLSWATDPGELSDEKFEADLEKHIKK